MKNVSIPSPSVFILVLGLLPGIAVGQDKTADSSQLNLGQTAVATADTITPGSRVRNDFVAPPLKYRPRPLWFWNDTAVMASEVEAQMQGNRDRSGYGGLAPLPFGGKFTPKYLSQEYFELYGAAVNMGLPRDCRRLGRVSGAQGAEG